MLKVEIVILMKDLNFVIQPKYHFRIYCWKAMELTLGWPLVVYFVPVLQVLMDMFSSEEDVSLPLVEEPIGLRTEAQSYEDIVKDFIFEETQYMRDLSQIIKVFRAPFVKHFPTSKVMEIKFHHISLLKGERKPIFFKWKIVYICQTFYN